MNSSQTDMGLIQFQPQHCESILIFNRVNELTVITSGVGAGGCATAPPLWLGLCRRRSGTAPPPIGVIRGAVVGVWLGFCLAKGRKGKEVEKCEKLLKTGRQNVLGREFVEIGRRPKKGRQIF
jgi:hypothetical protein